MNYRIVLYFLVKDNEIYLLDIDNHDNAYKGLLAGPFEKAKCG